jgi:hypothetical protein
MLYFNSLSISTNTLHDIFGMKISKTLLDKLSKMVVV